MSLDETSEQQSIAFLMAVGGSGADGGESLGGGHQPRPVEPAQQVADDLAAARGRSRLA